MEAVTSEQMREVDRLMVEEYGVRIIQMMESAGMGIAAICRQILGSLEKKKVLVLAGKGNNGGDGIVAARYLNNWGAKVKIVLSGKSDSDLIKDQIKIAENLNIDCFMHSELDLTKEISGSDVVIDAMIGYNLKGDPKEPVAGIIRRANDNAKLILSVDVPSGMDSNSGYPKNPCMKAGITATLALPKTGILKPHAKSIVGKIYLIDIGIPPETYSRFGIDPKIVRDTLNSGQTIKIS